MIRATVTQRCSWLGPRFRPEAIVNRSQKKDHPTTMRHDPVMVDEVLRDLDLAPGETVVDGTLGLGGHATIILEKIKPGGVLVGFDWDEQMLAEARARIGSPSEARAIFVHADYRMISVKLQEFALVPDAILLDLGLNSAQLEDPSRGISFSEDGPLDMRMDQSAGETAASLLNRASPKAIEDILQEFGDERWARAIAKKICDRRKETPLKTTNDLVECVLAAIPVGAREKRIHPATRTFQAIRIYVNRELDALAEALIEAAHCLSPGGRMVILSYHSGEDRAAKLACRHLADEGFEELHRKPVLPTESEVKRNPRCRSAKLRAIRRPFDLEGETE